jgi:hypothetical protein
LNLSSLILSSSTRTHPKPGAANLARRGVTDDARDEDAKAGSWQGGESRIDCASSFAVHGESVDLRRGPYDFRSFAVHGESVGLRGGPYDFRAGGQSVNASAPFHAVILRAPGLQCS